jgi:hypothetical protein
MVAEEQRAWAEAERYYRESLAIKERLGNAVGAAATCNQLASVAEGAGHPSEAEGWYKRSLELCEQVQFSGFQYAFVLSNLARLLKNEARAGRAPATRLAEARGYAERALAIDETLDASGIWTELSILADIAELEGRTEEVRDYRRRERKAYAAFEGNRYHIDRQFGQFISDVVAAAKGDVQARERVEADLPKLEARGWQIADATRRIWAGERDWHSLVEGVDSNSALLVLRVLETIAQQPGATSASETEDRTMEQVVASLPASIREALEWGDQAAFEQAFQALSPEEQQVVAEVIQYLQEQAQEEEETEENAEEEGGLDATAVVEKFEPLLQEIAMVAAGDTTHRSEIEEVLAELETKNFHIREAVQCIWAGERDAGILTVGLDEVDGALVRRVLEIVDEGKGEGFAVHQ